MKYIKLRWKNIVVEWQTNEPLAKESLKPTIMHLKNMMYYFYAVPGNEEIQVQVQ